MKKPEPSISKRLAAIRQRQAQATKESDRRRWEVVYLMVVLERYGNRALLSPNGLSGPRSWVPVVADIMGYGPKYVRQIYKTYKTTETVKIEVNRGSQVHLYPTSKYKYVRHQREIEKRLQEALRANLSPNNKPWTVREVQLWLRSKGKDVSIATSWRILKKVEPNWKEVKKCKQEALKTTSSDTEAVKHLAEQKKVVQALLTDFIQPDK